MKHDSDPSVLIGQAKSLGVYLSHGQAETLVAFEALLLERAVGAGLVAPGDAGRLRERHVLDCLRAVPVVRRRDRVAFDLGSGAGLPGLVVAIGCPKLSVVLVEPRHRRAAFLELALQRLALANTEVVTARAEDLGQLGSVDVCFARALAPLDACWRLARPLLAADGRLVYFAGERVRRVPEIAGARLLESRRSPVLESAGTLVIMAQ